MAVEEGATETSSKPPSYRTAAAKEGETDRDAGPEQPEGDPTASELRYWRDRRALAVRAGQCGTEDAEVAGSKSKIALDDYKKGFAGCVQDL